MRKGGGTLRTEGVHLGIGLGPQGKGQEEGALGGTHGGCGRVSPSFVAPAADALAWAALGPPLSFPPPPALPSLTLSSASYSYWKGGQPMGSYGSRRGTAGAWRALHSEQEGLFL